MAQYVMVLRRARSITRGIGRGGPWKIKIARAHRFIAPSKSIVPESKFSYVKTDLMRKDVNF